MTLRNKHIRCTHKRNRKQHAEAVKAADCKRKAAQRAMAGSGAPGIANVIATVICPKRRERTADLFTETRSHFAQHGLKVRRLEGFDWERGTYRSTLGGTMARKSEILMKYMHKVWIPAQIAALKKDPREEHKVGAPDSGRVAAVTLVLYRPVMIAEECGRTPLARVGQDFCQVYPLLHPAIVLDP